MFVRYVSVLLNTSGISLNTETCLLKQACGNKVLRGRHEWEQHKQGRTHRKRTTRLKKAQTFKNREKQEEEQIQK